jgi:sec-independent protein translocase protein TatA
MILLAISGGHILIVVIALLLLFGGKKIPELMGGIGKGMKDFKKAIKEDDEPSANISKEVHKDDNKLNVDNKKEPLKD